MARLLILGALAALILTVFCVVDVALTERERVRTLPKWTWLLLVVLLPVIGGVLWFLLGRRRLGAVPAAPRPIGPDDDPAFLRTSGRRPPTPVREPDEAEWRTLEQELANLDADATPDPDADDDDPRRR